MTEKRSKPTPLATGAGFGNAQSWTACIPAIIEPLADFQEKYLAARGVRADRARLLAGFCFGEGRP